MGRLIDEEELQKYIMHDVCEKGCGYIDERDLKFITTVEAIPKADYEEQIKINNKLVNDNEQLRAYITMMQADYNARLKASMVAMLTELQLEIEELEPLASDSIGFDMCVSMSSDIIQQKINALKGEV